MSTKLTEGRYPFAGETYDLADMAMVEAAPALEAFLKQQAAANGVELIRDEPVELKCKLEDDTLAAFLIWYPAGQDRIHLLVPKEHAKGRA